VIIYLRVDHPVPPGRIASFYAIPGTSCQATLMSPSGTIGRRPAKRTRRSAPLPNDPVGPRTSASSIELFTLALWRRQSGTKLALCESRASLLVAAPSLSPSPCLGALSFSIRNLSFFLAETDFFREGLRGDSNIGKRKLAQIAGVPLDYLGFILLTVRNKTKSPFPQRVCMSSVPNSRLSLLPVYFWKEVINE